MELEKLLKEYKERIDAELKRFFQVKLNEVGEIDREVGKLINSLAEIGLRGKRLRGFLFMIGYGLARGWGKPDWEKFPKEIWQGGMGIELFHLGLLVQDDVMDEDEVRRGVKTIWARYGDKEYGEAMANLAADMCFGWAASLMGKLGEQVVNEWGRYFERVAIGQVLDMKMQTSRLMAEGYGRVVELKTAEYTGEMPLVLGWLAGGRQKGEGEKLFLWGKRWGELFQWRDDLKDGDGLVGLVREKGVRERMSVLGRKLKIETKELAINNWWRERLRELIGLTIK